ncbi:MAG: flagellar hook-associated protein FlgK [Lachnospiraceae bacterium]
MANTMGSFYIGATGIQANQYALNATAHNITNAGTEGYSRQQILLSDMNYVKIGRTPVGINQSGLGTTITDVRLVRDRFVDKAYREELGREQYYQSKYEVVSEVQNYFGELENSSFRTTMQNLWTAAEELQKESNSIVTRSAFIARAVTFADQANEIYEQLTTYQKNLNREIQDKVDEINELANTIYDLNKKIVAVEASGVESANDFRDQRDHALDQLSGLISISYHENADGQVDVYAERRTLVSMDRIYEIDTKPVSEECEYLIPVWKDDQSDVFDMHYKESRDPRLDKRPAYVPSAETKTDVGSLKGLIMSRGDWLANYTDIPVAPEAPVVPIKSNYATDAEYNAAMAQYQTDYQQYQQDYEAYSKEVEFYNTYMEPYTVNNILAQFDQLIHGIVTKINDVFCPNKEVTLQDGSKIHILDEENAGYGMGEANQIQGVELFTRRTWDRYEEQDITLDTGETIRARVYREEDEDDYLSLYTLGNIRVNDELVKNPSLMGLSNLQGEELQDRADELVKMWDENFKPLNPNSLVINNFAGYYKEFVADFANKGYTYNGIAQSQQLTIQELNAQRQSVVGVSTDEELSNLIKFQQGFNASSRYFTVVSEMVEHLINKLGG